MYRQQSTMGVKILLVMTISAMFSLGVRSAIFTIKNNCPYTIYPAILTGSGQQAPTTGFMLASHSSTSINIRAPWSGRIWARFGCSNSGGRFTCLSGDCGTDQIQCSNRGGAPPSTLVEYTLAGSSGQDYYDISLVDGFNLPVTIQSKDGHSCRATGCPININTRCPKELAIRKPSGGGVIGCKSACLAFNQPQYCCTGSFSSPRTCKPTSYSRFFKGLCPNAYSYAYDDRSSLITCPTGANYLVTFCP